MAGVPHGENVWKTILIGVVITVVGYLIVHFIMDKKEHKKEIKEQREANENAWKSANDYIKSASKKFESIACFSCDYTKMKNELLRELEQDCNSLRNLKDEKLVDEKLKTVIDRTISRFNGMKPVFESYFDSIAVLKNITDTTVRNPRLKKAYDDFNTVKNRLDTADDDEIDRLLGAINDKYELKLKTESLEPEVNYSLLPGHWKVECTFEMNFTDDKKVTLTLEGETINGTWELNDNELTLNLDDGEILKYFIQVLSDKFLKIQAEGSGQPALGGCRI